MPFIPHTEQDIAQMLDAIGIEKMEALFAEIPKHLLIDHSLEIPKGMNEMQIKRWMHGIATNMRHGQCYIGAGAYEHHIPQAVWDIAQRGEYLTSYTPYQAEANQGTLQLLWEFQTMMASLMGLEVSNGSLYDGATALVEAILMAIRLQRHSPISCVWVPLNLHPFYRQVILSLLPSDEIKVREIPYDINTGMLSLALLNEQYNQPATSSRCNVLVIPQPNFFGQLENVNELTDWGHKHEAMVIGVVNPVAMGLLKPPGQWGIKGVDIACGEGQPLGVPLSMGGPYFGFLCCKQEYVRQMPGRLVGKTIDTEGKQGFTLTLQAREQHIRRGKATSNICTNQGLLVTAATVFLSLLGPTGLRRLALTCYQRAQFLKEQLNKMGVGKIVFSGETFHEIVLQLPVCAKEVLGMMVERGISAGFELKTYYRDLNNAILICVTETKTQEDINEYVKALQDTIEIIKRK